jgi:hypothetical protein
MRIALRVAVAGPEPDRAVTAGTPVATSKTRFIAAWLRHYAR